MSSELDSLISVLTSHVHDIQAAYISKNSTFPSLDDPNATLDLATDPAVMRATDVVVAAAKRLIVTVSNPNNVALGVASGMYGSALLNVTIESNVAEALKEAGPKGMHIRDLGAKVGVDHGKLGRGLRYLCAIHNLYREVTPDVFAHNRISMALDTGKSFEEVKDRGLLRYSGAKGVAAFAGHISDEFLKGAASIPEVLLNPEVGPSKEASKAALMKAFDFEGIWWEWFDQPEQKKRFHRYQEAIKNLDSFFPKELILSMYPWDGVPRGSVVVDVGGGIGGTTYHLARSFPKLRYIIQDRAPVIEDAKKSWCSTFPEAIESGLVELQAHDFFEVQPVKEAAIYILRFVIHTWADLEALKILQQLRQGMGQNSKVVILDFIVPYACAVEDTTLIGEIPEVLRGNLAPGHGSVYTADIQVLAAANAQERTTGEWQKLIQAAGLRVESINYSHISAIVCVPA